MRGQPKGEYIYDGKSYWLPVEIIQVLSECHQEIFEWRERWKMEVNQNNDLRDKYEELEIENQVLRDILGIGD